MADIWDRKADAVKPGDNLRDVSPLLDKTRTDENGFTHYVFSKKMFNNPWYRIPDAGIELFRKHLDGGSRSYPSDGSVPCDVVAAEARKVLNLIVSCSNDPKNMRCDDAKDALKHGKFALVRGTLKLYLGKYTTRDWRRKRFTDDIDFWTFQIPLLEHSLKECNFSKNATTKEWEKDIHWENPLSDKNEKTTLIAANDMNLLLDFGAGAYLEGTSLRQIFNKKLKRGHEVDLSDVINVAMVNNGIDGPHKDEWLDAWNSFIEAANTRNTRIISNLITLCRTALAIADHLEKVSKSIENHNDILYDKKEYSDEEIKDVCKTSIHWQEFLKSNGMDATRKMIHDFLHEQIEEKIQHAKNLRSLSKNVIELINSKIQHLSVIIEIED